MEHRKRKGRGVNLAHVAKKNGNKSKNLRKFGNKTTVTHYGITYKERFC
jgi:hypothetical protein